jgi:outer membrane lipoprotein-sorting protein
MRPVRRRAAMAALLLPLLLSGCLVTHRKLPVPIAPTAVQTVSPAELVAELNKRWEAMETLRAKVQIQFSVMKSAQGEAKDYTSFPGIILLRKPEMIRVYGQVPVLHSRMFDMVGDGKDFTLYVPSKSTVYKGLYTVTKKSANPLMNLRPGFFRDAMAVRGIAPDDEYMVTADTIQGEDPKQKRLLLFPEYILSVMRRKPGSREMRPIRVIHFHRDDLLPYQQELYDDQGNLETEVYYGQYAQFGQDKYPSTVTIKRPLEEYQVVITVDDVTENVQLPDDQFNIQLPEDTKIQTMQ